MKQMLRDWTKMFEAAIVVVALIVSIASGFAQQKVNGQGGTCSATNKRCYRLGGNAGICEPKFQQCLQTGTYYGNNYTVSNLARR